MTDLSWLSGQESTEWFGAATFHEPVRLRHLAGARLLWVNRQAAAFDPQFAGDMAGYERHLLQACAYVLAQDEDIAAGAATVTGHADRYGGAGIGNNGGSGRAALVNGYLVKGVGRTRLVSSLTEASHASGGAYLAESVREAICSEIVRAEFPHSAVPVLAIIDTGMVQVWDRATGYMEHRTLVVRPCFVRPAHFQRATAFISEDPKEGMRDSRRVQAMFAQALSTLGKRRFAAAYEDLWRKWARQLAYAFVHRLPHGSNTMSNICFDGKLLDFGAMSALPSWADCAIMMTRQPFAGQGRLLSSLISAAGYHVGRYLDSRYGNPDEQQRLAQSALEAYQQVVMVECLRLCGVRRGVAERAAGGADRERIWRCMYRLFSYFQRELIDMVERTPAPRLPWDLARVWSDAAPPHLHALRSLVLSLVGPEERDRAARRCAFLSATRDTLFREEAKERIYLALDRARMQGAPERPQVEHFISREIASGRRDHRVEAGNALAVGFAVSPDASYVLFQEHGGADRFALPENPLTTAAGASLRTGRIAIDASGKLDLPDGTPPFSGYVHLH